MSWLRDNGLRPMALKKQVSLHGSPDSGVGRYRGHQ